jgi:hypothetical protein
VLRAASSGNATTRRQLGQQSGAELTVHAGCAGIWMSKGRDMPVLVMDVEGTDGRERGEDQVSGVCEGGRILNRQS